MKDADELPDDVDARLGEIETALAAFDNRPLRLRSCRDRARRRVCQHRCRWNARCRSRLCPAGGRAVASVDPTAKYERRMPTATGPTTLVRRSSAPSSPSAGRPKPRRTRTMTRSSRCRNGSSASSPLTAPWHCGMRSANNPHVALTALLHKLCLDTFQHSAPRRLPGSLGAACVLPRPGDGSEGQCLCQGGRRAARGLEGRAAQGRRRRSGTGSRRSTTPGALRFSRIASRSA